ncbi:unnamed protein product, partial [Coregonus sp. 'balchen']
MGLPHAVVTKDISVGCEAKKLLEAITTMSPKAVLSVTLPLLYYHGSDRDRKRPGQNFLVLKDLVVPEGGRAPLESKHIKVNLEFRKLGIRQSQIMFRIEEQPMHGQLRLDMNHFDQEEEGWTFSMLDLWHGRVMYVHGGSEDPQDFTNSKKEIPFYLKGNKLHRFNVSATPVKDAPELSLPKGSLFMLLENSKRHLNTDVLRTTDLDSNSTDLVFKVLGNHNAETGFLEKQDHPGTTITTFSQPDLEEGKVSYLHIGGLVRNSRMAVRVSDGDKVSNIVVLRIMAVQLEHKVANNTGVEVNQGGAAIISSQHLATQVNVVKQVFDICSDVASYSGYTPAESGSPPPYLNTFQRIKTSNVTDQFKCKVSFGSAATDVLVFHITVRWIHFKAHSGSYDFRINIKADVHSLIITNKGLSMLEGESKVITKDRLFAKTVGSKAVLYTLTSSAKQGKLKRIIVLMNDTGHKLYQFCQEDMHHRRVLFIPRGVSSGCFVLFVSDGKHYTSTLLEVIAQDPYIQVENNTGLLVQKGQTVVLGSANLSVFPNLDGRDDKEVVYEVFIPPRTASVPQRLSVKEVRLDASIGVRVYLESHQQPPTVLYIHIIVVEEAKPVKINRGDLE